MKYSKQRDLVLNALKQNRCHPTAEQLFALLRDQGATVSLATVYRNLKQLTSSGLVKRLDNIDDATHFEYAIGNHYHFICSQCSRIIDIDPSPFADLEQCLIKRSGLAAYNAEISLRGICPDCLNHHKHN